MPVWLALCLLLARPASAMSPEEAMRLPRPSAVLSPEEAREKFNKAMAVHLDKYGAGQAWLKRKGELKFSSIEAQSLTRGQDGYWTGIADFVDVDSAAYQAEATADLESLKTQIRTLRWLTPNPYPVAASSAAASGIIPASAKTQAGLRFIPELTLPDLEGGQHRLTDCAGPKCLTVVVAPWCPHCDVEYKVLAEVADYLKPKGVEVRFVVNGDTEPRVRAFAKEKYPTALLDLQGLLVVPAYPQFITTINGGLIIKQDGFSMDTEKDPARYAKVLGLP